MANLPIDPHTSAWHAVDRYVTERIAELTEECIGTETEARRRDQLAARIAELRELLSAPERTRRGTEMAASHAPRSTY